MPAANAWLRRTAFTLRTLHRRAGGMNPAEVSNQKSSAGLPGRTFFQGAVSSRLRMASAQMAHSIRFRKSSQP